MRSSQLTGYHYTNARAYRSIQTKGIDGYYTFGFDEFAGLIPRHRFIRLGEVKGLPEDAHNGVVEGLLEPEPESWIHNDEFPNLWGYLMHDICKEKEIMLLSFPILRADKAYVVERAHVERELYREAKGDGAPTARTKSAAYRRYWKSRIHAFDYKNDYTTPQLAIWSGIPFERLRVEWIKPVDDVWNRVLKNNW